MTGGIKYPDILNDCKLHRIRKLAREVTLHYDQCFANIGIRSTQFILLVLLHKNEDKVISQLCREIGMDRTTLNRNVVPFLKKGLIYRENQQIDKRLKIYRLTEKGLKLIEEGIPLWKMAQSSVKFNVRMPSNG